MHGCQEKNSLACKLPIGDTKIKQVQKFKYLDSVEREDGKCDAEIIKRSENEGRLPNVKQGNFN